jgi:hypothetical protein
MRRSDLLRYSERGAKPLGQRIQQRALVRNAFGPVPRHLRTFIRAEHKGKYVNTKRRPIQFGLVGLCLLLCNANAVATVLMRETNIVELLGKSELILRGSVTSVTDGIDARGLPYTEVTLHVAEAIRGEVGTEYTFRQFGLLKPRSMGNGMVNLMVTPAGWTTYARGEEAILFLNRHAKYSGLQTTVGLSQGKFKVSVAGTTNEANNSGLFAHVKVEPNLLGESDRRVMSTKKGAVDTKAFVSLVRKAVNGRWIEQGSMRNE